MISCIKETKTPHINLRPVLPPSEFFHPPYKNILTFRDLEKIDFGIARKGLGTYAYSFVDVFKIDTFTLRNSRREKGNTHGLERTGFVQ